MIDYFMKCCSGTLVLKKNVFKFIVILTSAALLPLPPPPPPFPSSLPPPPSPAPPPPTPSLTSSHSSLVLGWTGCCRKKLSLSPDDLVEDSPTMVEAAAEGEEEEWKREEEEKTTPGDHCRAGSATRMWKSFPRRIRSMTVRSRALWLTTNSTPSIVLLTTSTILDFRFCRRFWRNFGSAKAKIATDFLAEKIYIYMCACETNLHDMIWTDFFSKRIYISVERIFEYLDS